MTESWKQVGIEVVMLFGPDYFEPADVLIVHVDLTVVPGNYLAFSRRFPVVFNGCAKDISKRLVSKNLIDEDDPYRGPELKAFIGNMYTALILRIDLGDNPSFSTVIKRTKEAKLSAFANQGVPFDMSADKPQLDCTRRCRNWSNHIVPAPVETHEKDPDKNGGQLIEPEGDNNATAI